MPLEQLMTHVRDFKCAETLKNGLEVTFRAMHPEDRDRVATAIRKLDPESVYSRLFSYRKDLTDAGLDRVMTVDDERDMVLLVTTGIGPEEIVIGSGRYVALTGPSEGRTAEVAFVVDEGYRGLGIASRLLTHLTGIARQRGIVAFEADVLGSNKSMLDVFARSGLPMRQRREGGLFHVMLSLVSG